MQKEDETKAAAEEDVALEKTSLFPLLHHYHHKPSSEQNNANDVNKSNWLYNPSFTTDLSVINDAVSSRYTHTTTAADADADFHSEAEEKQDNTATRNEPPSYELLHSSGSDRDTSYSSGESKRRRRKEMRKKRKRKLSNESARPHDYANPLGRRDHQSWASHSAPLVTTKDYYFDSRGDRDNLAFGSLYRMDVARYKPYNATKGFGLYYYRALHQRSWGFGEDSDADLLDTKLKSGGRYCSAKYTALERHKNLKRIRIIGPEKPVFFSAASDFIPLSEGNSDGKLLVEESWEDEVLRKTRVFNMMTRENPHDVKVWLDFAEFQDKVASAQPQKAARLQTLEKKISILEVATELNPDNEDLLLCLMNNYQSRDATDVFIGRWEKVLMEHSGSYKLWREFLRVVKGDFSSFKVSEMRKLYMNAVRALSASCLKQHRQVHQTTIAHSIDSDIVQQELCLVDIFLSLCRFEWQAGYQELATALFQAEIEFSLFCPSLLLTHQNKTRLFEHFWNSSGARIGEDGALGWSTWLEKQEEYRQKPIGEESLHEIEEGGWTGWSEPPSKNKEIESNPENILDHDVNVEEIGEEAEKIEIVQKDDIESLLKKLGISSDVGDTDEVRDTKTWNRWSKEELSRDSSQWMPVHAKSDRDGDEQLLREILVEDVGEYMFSVSSEQARLSLVFQFIDFYGGRISQWTSTNSSSWIEKTLSLEVLPDSILDDLRRIHDILMKPESPSSLTSEFFQGISDDISMRTSKMKFLRNAILLCLTAFPRNHVLEEAALVAEELSNTEMHSCSFSVTPCRALAKSLIKSNRQDILLCGVYARREAAFGNIEHARKVFDMALSSIEGLPSDSQSNAPLLYFWYAELEQLANDSGDCSESSSRAMHILYCLGSGLKYSPFKCLPSSTQQLRARLGYKERLRRLWSTWARGVLDDHSVALICCAALFEGLTTGWTAGIQIFNEAFSMVLPERKSLSHQFEFLFNYYVRMLQKHREQLKLSEVWDSVVQGLQLYPLSPLLYDVFLETSHFHTAPNKLRRMFDNYCLKKPSVIVWLFALSFEISRGSPHHRVHGLFERALANETLGNSVILWRWYISYEMNIACNSSAARRIYFRAIHACPWSKKLWLDGFLKLHSVLTAKELSDLQEVMRDKELNLRTDIYEILLQDEIDL